MNESLNKPNHGNDNGLKGSQLKRPMDKDLMGTDTASLNALCAFLNNPAVTGAEVPKGESTKVIVETTPTDISGATMIASDPATTGGPVTVMPEAAPVPPAPQNFSRLFFTGRLGVGKDHMAGLIGAEVHGLSEPLYAMASYFFGIQVDANTNKELPGIREFLQKVGMWGRRHIANDYPLSPERAVFIDTIQRIGADAFDSKLGVSWHHYGTDENLWLDAAIVRMALSEAPRQAVTNVRFANEFKRMSEQGFINWHVMTTPAELQSRQAKRGVKPGEASLKDVSEALADALDRQVVKTVSAQKNGPMLRVIWNSNTPPPSPRLWTVAQFVGAANAK